MQYNWTPYAIGGATRPDSFSGMTPEMQRGLWNLLQAADAEFGPGLQVYSGYRSPELQAQLYDAALKKYGSPEKARKWVAPPGRSKHNSGQAADLKYNGTRIDKLPEDHPVRQWLTSNVANYGLAQPMAWEPWQVEQVGARGQSFGGQAMGYGNTMTPTQPAGLPGLIPGAGAMDYGNTTAPQPSNGPGIWGALASMTEEMAAPAMRVPQMTPPQVAPIKSTRRDMTPAYLNLFRSLMG